MPASVQGAVVFALLIVPGFLLLRGYATRRTGAPPPRDLYALAQSLVASIAWLAAVWAWLVVLGDPLERWGMLPFAGDRLSGHRNEAILLLAVVALAPFPVGALLGEGVDRLASQPGARWSRLLGWTRIFEPPGAWERAWLSAANEVEALPAGRRYLDVSVRLKSGVVVQGRYGSGSEVDLSPRSGHDVYLETGFGVPDAAPDAVEPADATRDNDAGVYIEGSEIVAIYFRRARS